MLIEREKYHLNQLLEKYSFEHLRPPPQVYEIQHSEQQIWRNMGNGEKKRHIFWKVPFTQKEVEFIEQIRKLSHEYGIFENLTDEIILKHSYVAKFDIDKTFERLQILQQYHNNKIVTRFGYETLKQLESGSIYSYGFSKQLNPLIIIRADRFIINSKVDQERQIAECFNCVYFLLIVIMNFKMVPYHNQKYITVMDFNNMDLKDIPYKFLYDIMSKMNIYYCGNAQRAFVFNSKTVKKMWDMTAAFIPANVKKNVIFVEEGQESAILEYVDPMQLQKRYGGQLDNLEKYWPPQSTNKQFDEVNMSEKTQETDFFSVENNNEIFEQEKGLCGQQQCSCDIF